MTTTELSADMTSEDLKSYADTIAQEVAQERQGEKKSDAEIVVNTAKKTPVENSDSDTAPVEGEETSSEATETTGAPEVAEWVNDEVKAEIAAYGIDESDLSDFASREDLDKALRLLDKTALQTGRKALAEESPARNEKGQFVKKAEPVSEEPAEETPKEGRYEVQLNKDLYDEEVINEFSRLRDHYESRFEALEAHFTEMSARAEEQQFDTYVDSLGHADLFGKTGSESPAELERRRDLLVQVKAQMIGLEKLGRPTELTDKVVARVANMVFAEELAKKRLKQQTAKISKQSNLRQGGSPTKPLPPSEDPRAEADRLYDELSRK